MFNAILEHHFCLIEQLYVQAQLCIKHSHCQLLNYEDITVSSTFCKF